MSSWDLINNAPLSVDSEPTEAACRKVALAMCARAGTAAEARPVLEALGLVEALTPSAQGRRQR